ncbi:MAG TPA: DUF1559 domain-containing protein [Lacipirellulaceae bacterium]|nr:DUF1559 domain-containing protein [Lacipirellulaceae bacterium]
MNARSRPGWTLVELLVVVAIIGALVALTLPAIQSAREAARSVHCRNNLRQIAVATLQHVDAYGAFPPARLQPHPADPASSCSGGQPSWLVRVLAYLDRQASFSRWRIYDSFADHDEQLRLEIVPVLGCPTRRDVASAAMRTPFRLEWVEPTALAVSHLRFAALAGQAGAGPVARTCARSAPRRRRA